MNDRCPNIPKTSFMLKVQVHVFKVSRFKSWPWKQQSNQQQFWWAINLNSSIVIHASYSSMLRKNAKHSVILAYFSHCKINIFGVYTVGRTKQVIAHGLWELLKGIVRFLEWFLYFTSYIFTMHMSIHTNSLHMLKTLYTWHFKDQPNHSLTPSWAHLKFTWPHLQKCPTVNPNI